MDSSLESRLINYCIKSNSKHSKKNINGFNQSNSLIMTHQCSDKKNCSLSRETSNKTKSNSYYYSHHHKDYGKVDLYPYSNLIQLQSMSHYDYNAIEVPQREKMNDDSNESIIEMKRFEQYKGDQIPSILMEANKPLTGLLNEQQDEEKQRKEDVESMEPNTTQLRSSYNQLLQRNQLSITSNNSQNRLSHNNNHKHKDNLSINCNGFSSNSKLKTFMLEAFENRNIKPNYYCSPINTLSTKTNITKILNQQEEDENKEENDINRRNYKQKESNINWDDIRTIRLFSNEPQPLSSITKTNQHSNGLLSSITQAHNYNNKKSNNNHNDNNMSLKTRNKPGNNSQWRPYSLRSQWKNFKSEIYPKNSIEQTILFIDTKTAYL